MAMPATKPTLATLMDWKGRLPQPIPEHAEMAWQLPSVESDEYVAIFEPLQSCVAAESWQRSHTADLPSPLMVTIELIHAGLVPGAHFPESADQLVQPAEHEPSVQT